MTYGGYTFLCGPGNVPVCASPIDPTCDKVVVRSCGIIVNRWGTPCGEPICADHAIPQPELGWIVSCGAEHPRPEVDPAGRTTRVANA